MVNVSNVLQNEGPQFLAVRYQCHAFRDSMLQYAPLVQYFPYRSALTLVHGTWCTCARNVRARDREVEL